MPAYNFQKRFAPLILKGSKRQTIRRRRKRPTQPGDPLFLYTGLRTRECRFLVWVVCSKVTPVTIYPYSRVLKVNGRVLKPSRVEQIARRDGFSNQVEFFDFFWKTYQEETLDGFELIEWKDRDGTE